MLHDPYSETAFITGDSGHRFHLLASSQPALPTTIPPQGFYHAAKLFPHMRLSSDHRVQFRLNFIRRKTKLTEIQADHENFVVPSLRHRT